MLALLSAACGHLRVEPPMSTGRRIADAFGTALRAKDLEWCERHLAARFTYTGQKGDRHDRDWMLGRLRTWFHPFGYHVDASLALVSARPDPRGLRIVSDIAVSAQLFGFRRMPLTVTTVRGESLWVRAGSGWAMAALREVGSRKTVDGKVVERNGL